MKMIKNSIVLLLLALAFQLNAQKVILDKGIRAGELQLFPDVSAPNNYYYMADKIRIAQQNDGTPYFSFIKYVRNEDTASASSSGISTSNNGGGIVHAVVTFDVTDEMKKEAEKELKRFNANAKIAGPIIYKAGKIMLVSASIEGNTTKVIGVGNAPLLEGQKAAISVMLNKEGADILWATFQTPTPDISFRMEMEIAGYQSPKNVTIEADFDQMYTHRTFEAAVAAPVFAGEIHDAMEELENNGTIKVTQIGEDENLNTLKESVYNKLMELMFDKVGGQSSSDLGQLTSMAGGSNTSMLDRATTMLTNARNEAKAENEKIEAAAAQNARSEAEARAESRRRADAHYEENDIDFRPPNPNGQGGDAKDKGPKKVAVPEISIAVSFKRKRIKRTGKYFVNLNKYSEEDRTFPFSQNVGNILKDCPSCLKKVNLDDPLYKQRDILVNLIDVNATDFGQYIGSVEVLMKKNHEGGEETFGNIVVDKNVFLNQANNFKMQYGWKDDNNRDEWLNYEFKTKWAFSGGNIIETDWQTGDFGAIDMVPPLEKKDVYVELDPDFAEDEDIRAIEVKLFFKNGDKEEKRTVNIKTRDNILSQSAQLILPRGVDNYEYEITYFVKGKRPQTKERIPYDYSSIYIDTF